MQLHKSHYQCFLSRSIGYKKAVTKQRWCGSEFAVIVTNTLEKDTASDKHTETLTYTEIAHQHFNAKVPQGTIECILRM